MDLLGRVVLAVSTDHQIGNVDVTVIIEAPKLAPYREAMAGSAGRRGGRAGERQGQAGRGPRCPGPARGDRLPGGGPVDTPVTARWRPGRGAPGRPRAPAGRASPGASSGHGRGPRELGSSGRDPGTGPGGEGARAPCWNGAGWRPWPSPTRLQGVVARADPLPDSPLEALVRVGGNAPVPFLVVLDGVTDPHNLGAVMRSALSAGATGLVTGRHRSAPLSPAAFKAAAGAAEYLPVAIVPGVPAVLTGLAAAGVWTVAVDAEARTPVWDLGVATEPVASGPGRRGTWPEPAGSPALRPHGPHPAVGSPRVAQRGGRGRPGLFRGGPGSGEGRRRSVILRARVGRSAVARRCRTGSGVARPSPAVARPRLLGPVSARSLAGSRPGRRLGARPGCSARSPARLLGPVARSPGPSDPAVAPGSGRTGVGPIVVSNTSI